MVRGSTGATREVIYSANCSDLFGMTSSESGENLLAVEGVELRIPTATGIPLALITSELITNAIKYAPKGKIAVGLQSAGKERKRGSYERLCARH